MKIYTKTGDKGQTSLVSGRRVSKAEELIEAYGTVDELNAYIGDLLSVCSDGDVIKDLTYIQHILFNIGSLLAKDGVDLPDYPMLKEQDITYLEDRIDKMNESLEKMTAFILPVGTASISKAHICRTVCRRAERRVIAVADEGMTMIVQYLNRLSDHLFVLARYFHHIEQVPEVKWDGTHRDK